MEQPSWNEGRLDDLNKRVGDGFKRMDRGFEKVDEEFKAVRKEMNKGFEKLNDRFTHSLWGLLGVAATIVAALITAPHL